MDPKKFLTERELEELLFVNNGEKISIESYDVSPVEEGFGVNANLYKYEINSTPPINPLFLKHYKEKIPIQFYEKKGFNYFLSTLKVDIRRMLIKYLNLKIGFRDPALDWLNSKALLLAVNNLRPKFAPTCYYPLKQSPLYKKFEENRVLLMEGYTGGNLIDMIARYRKQKDKKIKLSDIKWILKPVAHMHVLATLKIDDIGRNLPATELMQAGRSKDQQYKKIYFVNDNSLIKRYITNNQIIVVDELGEMSKDLLIDIREYFSSLAPYITGRKYKSLLNVVHADLTPDNILFKDGQDDGAFEKEKECVMVDFDNFRYQSRFVDYAYLLMNPFCEKNLEFTIEEAIEIGEEFSRKLEEKLGVAKKRTGLFLFKKEKEERKLSIISFLANALRGRARPWAYSVMYKTVDNENYRKFLSANPNHETFIREHFRDGKKDLIRLLEIKDIPEKVGKAAEMGLKVYEKYEQLGLFNKLKNSSSC